MFCHFRQLHWVSISSAAQVNAFLQPRKHCSKVAAETARNLLIFPPASTSGYWTGCSRPSGNRRWEEHVSAHPETEANGAPVTHVAIPWIRSWSVKAHLSWFSSLERWSEMLASNGTPTPVKEYQGVGLDHWNCIQSYRPTAVSLSCNLAQLRITQCQAPFPDSSLDTATSLETKTV